jgi:REP element-mobilizing transposase RayT
VRRYWGDDNTADLIKPVRLQTTSKNHLLSATVLAVGIILALTFDGETPFDILRSQTRYLTGVLKNPRLTMPDVHILPKNAEAQLEVVKKPSPREFITDDYDVTRPAHDNPDAGELTTTPPVFSPEVHAAPTNQSAWTGPTQPQPRNPYSQTSFIVHDNQPVDANSPINVTGEMTRSSLGPTEPSLFDVFYSCLLVPRIQSHELDEECASFLRAELPNIFLANGWRLEELVISTTYMQWVVRIPPTLAPASHIKVIRRESSQMILENFARFKNNEFLRDFWSPGYLLGGGRHLIPEAEIAEYIRMNRKQFYTQDNLHFGPKREPLNYRF